MGKICHCGCGAQEGLHRSPDPIPGNVRPMGGLWDEGPVLNTSTTSTAQSWDRMPGSPNTQDLLKIQTQGGSASTCRIFGRHSYCTEGCNMMSRFLNCHLNI